MTTREASSSEAAAGRTVRDASPKSQPGAARRAAAAPRMLAAWRGHDAAWWWRAAALLAPHLAALAVLVTTETDFIAMAAFVLAWVFLNGVVLAVLRRPTTAGVAALALVLVLIRLSQLKHEKLWLTVDFVDLMIIDRDTARFLLKALPALALPLAGLAAAAAALTALAWRIDRIRIGRRAAALGSAVSLAALVALALAFPTGLTEDFLAGNYVSKFARTGVEAVHEYARHGYLDAGPALDERLAADTACTPPAKLPHIILLHDESSFDITAAPTVRVPPDYSRYFRSSDGMARKLVVEGSGGPSWFTEFNVLTGLSAHSYGRFATSVTRIAAGRVLRGLPRALARCGYTTFSLYPFYGAFLGSQAFQETAGIAHYRDMAALGTTSFEPDHFYFDRAREIVGRERSRGPLFLYVYTVANHFPWDTRLRAPETPGWQAPGNGADVDDYLRRQAMTAHDYAVLLARLRQEFPDDAFLIVRYGDHQPEFATRILEPALGAAEVAQHLQAADPRYFATYYAIDAVNFSPADLSPALATIDAPYLPLVTLAAAGVPLDASFAEQKRILQRCGGVFYRCNGGTEAQRFNRLLMDAGLLKGF